LQDCSFARKTIKMQHKLQKWCQRPKSHVQCIQSGKVFGWF
jgi:hypothetical protein